MATRLNKGSMTHSRRAHAYPEGELPEGPGFDGFQPETEANDEAVEAEPEQSPRLTLLGYLDMDNVAEALSEDELGRLGAKVCEEYDIDDNSRSDWKDQNKDALKLAKQVEEKKSYPWAGASNVKYPLITKAAIEFNSRAYPAMVTNDLVKCKVNGYDPDNSKAQRAERVSKTMSWQCLEEMPNWDEETDKLTMVLPIVGMAFKKTYFSRSEGTNASDLVMPNDLVFNYSASSFSKVPRKTHKVRLYPYEIKERVNGGLFLDNPYGMTDEADNDPDAQHMFLEQHRLEDLDGDGYPEPYIVTVHKQTQKVCRIVTRFYPEDIEHEGGEIVKIKPIEHFTKFGFIPNPDGSAHDIGFGTVCGPINRSINTVLNQLLDAGHLANTQGGFIGKGLRMKGGSFRLRPGEYRPVDTAGVKIRENLVPMQFPGPSPVLFQLLGALIEAGEDVAQIRDVLEGNAQGANQPASTTLALIEQGLKVFSGIYKRMHRSFGHEFKALFKLNQYYFPLQKHVTFLDAKAPVEVQLQDFNDEDLDVSPMSDPAMVTDMQRAARAEALMGLRGTGNWDDAEIERRYLEALSIPDIDDLVIDPQAKGQQQMMQMMMMREEMNNKRMEVEAKLLKAKSGAIKDIADAESKEAGDQLSYYQAATDRLTAMIQAANPRQGADNGNGAGRVAGPGGPARVA